MLEDKEGGREQQEQDVGVELVVDVAAVWRAPSEGRVQSVAEITPRPTCGITASDALATKTLHGERVEVEEVAEVEQQVNKRRMDLMTDEKNERMMAAMRKKELEDAHILDEVEEIERTVFGDAREE